MLVLKAPQRERGNKGVLLLMFTEHFSELGELVELDRLAEDYLLVLEPSYSGYADAAILQFQRLSPNPVFVMATEARDFAFVQRIRSNLVPVRLGSSDWVHPRVFSPIANIEKQYDSIMVAGWERLKRHHAFFRAVAELNDLSYRFCLVGGSWLGSRVEIDSLLDYYGVRKQADVFEGLSPADVNRKLNMARVNVLLTHREGSNRSLFEGMFAGTPALALSDVIGPNHAWIQPPAGRLVRESELAKALDSFRHGLTELRPREWALTHISPLVSTGSLESAISTTLKDLGVTWHGGLAIKVNAPEAQYFDADDRRSLPTAQEILREYARAS